MRTTLAGPLRPRIILAAAAVLSLLATACVAVYPVPISRDNDEPGKVTVRLEQAADARIEWHSTCDHYGATLRGISADIQPTVMPPFGFTFPAGVPATGQSGQVYFTDNAQLVAAMFDDGEIRWKRPTPGVFIQVIEYENLCAVYSVGKDLYALECLDAMTGDLKWKDAAPIKDAHIASADGRLYSFNHYQIRSNDILNGDLLWEKEFGEFQEVVESLTVGSDGIFVNIDDRRNNTRDTIALDFLDKTRLWIHMGETVLARDGEAFVLRNDVAQLNVRDTKTGELIRYHDLPNFDGEFFWMSGDTAYYSAKMKIVEARPPVVGKDGVHILPVELKTTRSVTAFDLKLGKAVWHCDITALVGKLWMTFGAHTITVMSGPKQIGLDDWAFTKATVIDANSGKIAAEAAFDNGIVSAKPLGTSVFIASRRGWLYCLYWMKK